MKLKRVAAGFAAPVERRVARTLHVHAVDEQVGAPLSRGVLDDDLPRRRGADRRVVEDDLFRVHREDREVDRALRVVVRAPTEGAQTDQ